MYRQSLRLSTMRPSFYKLSSCPVSILSKTTRLLAQQKLPLLTSHSSIFYGTLPVLPPQLLDGIERKLHEARDALDRLKQQGDTVISPVTIRTILNGTFFTQSCTAGVGGCHSCFFRSGYNATTTLSLTNTVSL